MAAHARLSPSKGDLWMVCPGGIPFAEANAHLFKTMDVVSPTGAAALGTLAHSYSEHTIRAMLLEGEEVRAKEREAANDIRPRLTGELVKNAERYVSWAVEFVTMRPQLPWGLELRAPLWYEPESGGTADFWAVDGDTLVVVDYKSGRVPVKVKENVQIAIYLIAIYDELKAFNPQITKFRAGVMQPFSAVGHSKPEPRWWDMNMEEMERMKRIISAGAHEVWNPIKGQHRLVKSEKGCRWCPAKPICPAQNEAIEEFASLVDEDPVALDGTRLFAIFGQLKSTRDFLDSVEDYVREQSDEVLATNDLERQPGSKKRSWNLDEFEVAARLMSEGVEPFKRTLRTPADVTKEIAPEVVEDIITIDFNRPKLVSTKEVTKTFRVSKEK